MNPFTNSIYSRLFWRKANNLLTTIISANSLTGNIINKNSRVGYIYSLSIILLFAACNGKIENTEEKSATGIRPWSENPGYWEYKGKPLLLLGASNNDNLFQLPNLKSHLDSIAMIGGNYVRNTMSDRDETDEKAFLKNEDGKYNLEQWNPIYWQKFEDLLKLAQERGIIVQIEIWDRFDHAREQWQTDPFNPKNNINYTYIEAKLDSLYPDHPGQNKQPFFFTPPSLEDNQLLLKYQQAFVEKLLSISLDFNNVLYCLDNETSGKEEWATYWAAFLREKSGEKTIVLTEMWDHWDLKSAEHKRTLDHPERYDFIDISQNSHQTGEINWHNAQYVFNYIKSNPRPVNSVKIYGSDAHGAWLSRGITTQHAVETFFRNILGGFASSRFHRPPHGLGLSNPSIQSIRTIRKIEEKVKFWDLKPMMDRLSDRVENEAFLIGKIDETYLLYFPSEGEVKLDLNAHNKEFKMSWINLKNSEWEEPILLKGGNKLSIKTLTNAGSLALIQAK
ncbi:hypothetical protein [Cyclobacterium marinum]|uniref:Collagen-binding domain-containing protein n=1 Tax=Cyclobacterium marinum (strain ATCC 25205 / DSM 745 / LMG 13164 / NCIMB 1802) TaxID=880070 RepID=G0IZZ3_CYCMS|nr:hypothetical protein [Cyclobacterium marinum]AEL26495.1 hypothetical protein Cycma_2756 [Cyclobacterium marinum DSM 745]